MNSQICETDDEMSTSYEEGQDNCWLPMIDQTDSEIEKQTRATQLIQNHNLFRVYLLVRKALDERDDSQRITQVMRERLLCRIIELLLDQETDSGDDEDMVNSSQRNAFERLYIEYSNFYEGKEELNEQLVSSLIEYLDNTREIVILSSQSIGAKLVYRIGQFLKRAIQYFYPNAFDAHGLMRENFELILQDRDTMRLDSLILDLIERMVELADEELETIIAGGENCTQGKDIDWTKSRILEIAELLESCKKRQDLKRKLSYSSYEESTFTTESESSGDASEIKRIRAHSTPKDISLELNESKIGTTTKSKLATMSTAVQSLPGVGKEYSRRLREKNLSSLGDLVTFYRKKCNSNRQEFVSSLKNSVNMKVDSILKLLDLVEQIVDQQFK